MASILRVTPLWAAPDGSSLSLLLEVDEFRILLDCGADERYTNVTAHVEKLKAIAPHLDAVLISHASLAHAGMLPFLAHTHTMTNVNVYATTPVHLMAQMFLYEHYQARYAQEDFDLFSLDDIDEVFDRFITINFHQAVQLKGGITITAMPAGHTLGGAVWRVAKEEEAIVYAPVFNHRRERHLNPATLEAIHRPSVFITDAVSALAPSTKRRDLDAKLREKLLSTLRSDGTVLLVADTAARVLELLNLLERWWAQTDAGLTAYPVYFVQRNSLNVLDYAKTLVEFMSDQLLKQTLQSKADNPYALQHVRVVRKLPSSPGPKVLIVGQPSMEAGLSRDALIDISSDPKNLLLFTVSPEEGSLGWDLLQNGGDRQITLQIGRRVPLAGEELLQYREKRRLQLERERLESAAALAEQEESDEEDAQQDMDAFADTPAVKRRRLRSLRQGQLHPMFVFKPPQRHYDDYGEFYDLSRLAELDAPTISQVPMPEPAEEAVQAEQQEDEKEQEEEVPTKIVTDVISLQISCKIDYLDLNGRTDMVSMHRILGNMKPRQVVISHGPESAVSSLSQYLEGIREEAGIKSVYKPTEGDTVNATLEQHIYPVRLRDSLVTALKFSRAGDAELAWIEAKVVSKADLTLFEAEEGDDVPILTAAERRSGHQSVFIGNVRLSTFQQVLEQAGIQAEFSGGKLVCNGRVAIVRGKDGLNIEGALCPDYYKVRQLLYSQFAIV